MSESRRQLLTIGVFFIIVVVAILLYPTNVTHNWANIFQLIIGSVRSLDLGSSSYESAKPSKVRTLSVQHGSNGCASHGFRRSMVPVGLQLDLLDSPIVACARRYSNRFSNAKKNSLSRFLALNIFLCPCAVNWQKAQSYV